MRWYGKLLGFIAGWLLLRHPAGALVGLLIGHAFDADWFRPKNTIPMRCSAWPRTPATERWIAPTGA